MSFLAKIFGLILPHALNWAYGKIAALISQLVAKWRKEKEVEEAFEKVKEEKDQRDIEKVIGHPSPGEPSVEPGAEIVDAPPPNVRRP